MRLIGERLAQLLESSGPEVTREEAKVILQELVTALEELAVAEEELTVQAEQLAVSHIAVDAERERYAQLFDFAPDAYLETDGHGKILEANSAAERLLGVPVRFLVGKLVQSFVGASDVRAVRSALTDLRESDEPSTVEADIAPRDMDPVPVEMRLGSTFDPALGATGEARVRWLLRDISARLKLDREVRQLHADVELMAALAEVNRLVAASPGSLDPMLQELVTLAVRASGGAHAGITIADNRGRVSARAVSDPVAQELCDAQLQAGGPAVEVLRQGRPLLDHADALSEWPALAEIAARHDVQWIFSQPIPAGAEERGVLNLYGRGETEEAAHAIQLLANQAAAIITNGRLYTGAINLAHQLASALESRGVIEQAKGILMSAQGCDADTAFDILRRASQRENRKLRVIAEEVVAHAVARGGQP